MTMSNQYDVIMIGAGPSAIFCAYELKRNKPDMKVLMIEKGRKVEELKKEHVQNVTLKYVLDVNHVLLQQDLPEQEHSQMVNYPYPQM